MLSQIPLACSVCFKDPGSPLTSGLKLAVLLLLGVLFFVFAAFIKFIVGFRKRSQTINTPQSIQ